MWDSFGHIIAEHNATGGAALKQYIWLGDTPLALINGTTLYYVHPDNLDRPVFMTNATAMTVAWSAKYDPFGVLFAVTVTPSNTQRLPGQWFQSEDGLSYNWHRTYDPTLGRYTQADPLGFVDGPGIYNYVGQSPVMGVDAWGLYVVFFGGDAGGALGAGPSFSMGTYYDSDSDNWGTYFTPSLATGIGGSIGFHAGYFPGNICEFTGFGVGGTASYGPFSGGIVGSGGKLGVQFGLGLGAGLYGQGKTGLGYSFVGSGGPDYGSYTPMGDYGVH